MATIRYKLNNNLNISPYYLLLCISADRNIQSLVLECLFICYLD